jgi:hypothetical protein
VAREWIVSRLVGLRGRDVIGRIHARRRGGLLLSLQMNVTGWVIYIANPIKADPHVRLDVWGPAMSGFCGNAFYPSLAADIRRSAVTVSTVRS